jgi:glycine betaine/proline transport system permease protein
MSHPLTRDEAIAVFAGSSASYYKRAFALIGQSSRKVFSFNPAAALLGPIWLGGRRLWAAFWPFLIAELLALIIIAFAVGGGLTADVQARAARLETLAASRTVEAQAAESKVPGSAIATSLAQSARALEKAAREARAAETASSGTPWIIALGIALFIGIRFALGSIANSLFERSFRKWRANGQKTGTGFDTRGAVAAAGLMVLVVPVTLLNFVSAGTAIFDSVPANPDWNSAAAAWLDQTLSAISRTIAPAAFGVTRSIDVVLGLLESALIATPWPVVMTIILALAWQIAGFRIFLLTAVAITYLALLGYWEKSMQTVALLGTAALISIAIGIPLGIACGYNKRLAAGVRPVLDFMQTMPAFVYLIPVIALFGIGKPSGIIATIIFGIPPVVRLTALGISSVPPGVREAATAFGASRTFLLFRIDLPAAAPSIMAGISQTILMCLSMVVIAALIGAKGLGEDVLKSLQYAAQGQGLLAGFAILTCAIVLDRIVQGSHR